MDRDAKIRQLIAEVKAEILTPDGRPLMEGPVADKGIDELFELIAQYGKPALKAIADRYLPF